MPRFDAVILDVDGTIVRGQEPIPGAVAGIRKLDAAGIPRLLFSNNPTRGSAHYRETLETYGIDVDSSSVLTSGTVTAEFLADVHDGESIFLVGHDRLRGILEDHGLTVTSDPAEANLVLGSIDPDLSYDSLRSALTALERGVPFYGTDPDVTIPTADGRSPGSGTILAALSAAAGREPDAVLGKPSAVAADAATDRLGVPPEDLLVVGDRLDTDVSLGERAGMATAVVLTGITDRSDLETATVRPGHVLESIGDIDELLSSR